VLEEKALHFVKYRQKGMSIHPTTVWPDDTQTMFLGGINQTNVLSAKVFIDEDCNKGKNDYSDVQESYIKHV